MVAIVGRQRVWGRCNLRATKSGIHDGVTDEYLRAGTHGRFEAFEDLDAVFIRPVVSIIRSQTAGQDGSRRVLGLQNATQPVHVGAFDWVLLEEIVGHESDPSARDGIWSLARKYLLTLLDIFNPILDHKLELRVDGQKLEHEATWQQSESIYHVSIGRVWKDEPTPPPTSTTRPLARSPQG